MDTRDNREVTAYIIDAQTGAIRQEMRRGDRFIPMRLYEGEHAGEHIRLSGRFVKLCASALPLIAGLGISKGEWRCFWLLCGKVRYITGKAQHTNGRALTLQWIAGELAISRKTAQRCLAALQANGLVDCTMQGNSLAVWVNPYVCHVGQAVEKELAQRFSHTVFCAAYMEGGNG